MEEKILTIYYHYTSSGKEVPLIRLQGKWLQELGFLIGKKITVKESQGQLVLTLVAEGVKG